jgi:hypothetical protein
VDCRLCGADEVPQILDLGRLALTGIFPKSHNDEVPVGPLQLVRCESCGLVQLAHNYYLPTLYGETYGYRSGLNHSMVLHLASKVQQILNRVQLQPGDLVIDIGSNDGTLLNSYPQMGLRRVGVDPTGEKFRRYYQKGIELIPEFFSAGAVRVVAGHQKAKAITSIAMFYDLEHPFEFVSDLIEVLDDNGIWMFEQSYLPLMIKSNGYDTICHEHLEYYTLHQIRYIARKMGLKIIDVELSQVNGGSFCVTVAKQGAVYPEETELVDSILSRECAGGFDSAKPFVQFSLVVHKHRRDLRDLLTAIRSRGETVLGYGASTKGNVLLQYCGIDETLLPAIAEVNEDKFGSFTPGTRIPIISELEARERNPDYLLVLPWHFRDGIVLKESLYLESGGKLIFPLPEVEIVSAPREARPSSA